MIVMTTPQSTSGVSSVARRAWAPVSTVMDKVIGSSTAVSPTNVTHDDVAAGAAPPPQWVAPSAWWAEAAALVVLVVVLGLLVLVAAGIMAAWRRRGRGRRSTGPVSDLERGFLGLRKKGDEPQGRATTREEVTRGGPARPSGPGLHQRGGARSVQSESSPLTVDAGNWRVQCVSFSPKDNMIAAGCSNGKVHLVDATTGGVKSSVVFQDTHDKPVSCVAFSTNGSTISAGDGYKWGSSEYHVRLYDVQTGDVKSTLTVDGAVTCLSHSPDEESIAVGSACSIYIFRAQTGEQSQLPLNLPLTHIPALAFSPHGLKIAAACNNCGIRSYSVKILSLPPEPACTFQFEWNLTGHDRRVSAVSCSCVL